MNAIQKHFSNYRLFRISALLTLIGILMIVGVVYADVPTRVGVRGTVPNTGTQQQELPNITIPAPYNVFEFVVTCMACHGGTVDQNTGHGGNWAGSSMASAARDPIFRANQVIVNNAAGGILTGRCIKGALDSAEVTAYRWALGVRGASLAT